jgi:hypothetical protein
MINNYTQTYHISNNGDTTSMIAAAPTPPPVTPQSGSVEPPVGWVFAGILLILLVMMLYQSIKRFVLKLLKKDRPTNSRRK